MGKMHKDWSAAKKQVKTKGWEAKLKFKDDFGKLLDGYDKRTAALDKIQDSLRGLLREHSADAVLIRGTAKSYEAKLKVGEKANVINAAEVAALTKVLKSITTGVKRIDEYVQKLKS